jgi:hypothetical protein
MSTIDLKDQLALADLVRDLARAEERRKKRFAAVLRFVRRGEAIGPARDFMAQIRRDCRLCQLLVDYETESEIIGMMEICAI